MVRFGESILGGLAAAVFTRNFVIAAVVVVLLYVAWEQGLAPPESDVNETEDIDNYFAVYDDAESFDDKEWEDTDD